MRLRDTGRASGLVLVLASLLASQSPSISFTGYLERVGDGSVSVKLADRRVIDAMLPEKPALQAAALAAQYRMGDEVRMECRQIEPVWEADTSRRQSLEVTGIKLLRRPSPAEVAGFLEARAREGKNLLQRPASTARKLERSSASETPGGTEWEHARKVNLAYAEDMPNFVADEIAKRYRSTDRSPDWKVFDRVESEIAFRGQRAQRQNIRRNGKPWGQSFEALPGFKWYEGFETEIGPLFDPQCPTAMQYRGRSTANGLKLLEYRFDSPVDGCFPFLYFAYQRYNPARSGKVLIDDPGGNVIQVDDEEEQFPADFEFGRREEHMFWDYVKIGKDSHLLPVRATFLVVYSDGTSYRVEVEYKNHRHFESSSKISFH
jgi:hypothetical protein